MPSTTRPAFTATPGRNATRHFAVIDIETGETLAHESRRNTLGGHVNMIGRLADAFGMFVRLGDEDGTFDTGRWLVKLVEVNKL